MMQGKEVDLKLNLIMDVGNSDIKLITVNGKSDVNGNVVVSERYIPNRYAQLFGNENLSNDYYGNNESLIYNLSCEEVTGKETKLVENMVCTGRVADTELVTRLMRSSSANKIKSVQMTTKFALATSIISAVREVIGLETYKNLEIVNLDLKLIALLPPDEYYTGVTKSDLLSNELSKCKVIEDYITKTSNVRININLQPISIFSEAVMTYVATVFNGDGTVQTDKEGMLDGYVLVIDIGEGTSDIILMRDGRPVYNTRDTFKLGGRSIEASATKAIREEHNNFTPTPERLRAFMETGIMQVGNRFEDMSEILLMAKQDFVANLYNHINNYFSRFSMDLTNLNSIIFCGGGSLPSRDNGRETTPSVQKLMLGTIKTYSNIDLDAVTARNTRFSNAQGAYISAVIQGLLI